MCSIFSGAGKFCLAHGLIDWLQSETLISIFFLQSFFFLINLMSLKSHLNFTSCRDNNKDLLQIPWLD